MTVDGELPEGLGRSDISSRCEKAVMAGCMSVDDGSDTEERDEEDGGDGDTLSSRVSCRRRESRIWILSMMSWRVGCGEGGGGGDTVAALED